MLCAQGWRPLVIEEQDRNLNATATGTISDGSPLSVESHRPRSAAAPEPSQTVNSTASHPNRSAPTSARTRIWSDGESSGDRAAWSYPATEKHSHRESGHLGDSRTSNRSATDVSRRNSSRSAAQNCAAQVSISSKTAIAPELPSITGHRDAAISAPSAVYTHPCHEQPHARQIPDDAACGAHQTMDILEIMSLLPHRYPFLLIDRVIEMERKPAHRRHQERHHQRAPLPGPLPRLPHHARRPHGRSHRPGRRRSPPHRNPRPRLQAHGLHQHRKRPLPPPRHPRRPAPHRSHRPQLAQPRRQDGRQHHRRRQTRLRRHRHVPGRPPRHQKSSKPRSRQQSEHPPHSDRRRGAQIPASCTIGPYCTIGPNVILGENCELVSHVVLGGETTATSPSAATTASSPSPASASPRRT